MTKALILDRDGVINKDHEYVSDPANFDFLSGIFELCRRAQEAGFVLVVITNQSGVARGFYSEWAVARLHAWMRRQFRAEGIDIARVYYCPHHPDIGNADYRLDCECRKPRPGMILAAQKNLDLDLIESVLVGDKISDMEAAEAAGVGRRILLAQTVQTDSNAATEVITSLDQIRL
jgi:D-glycero-D-manno-heptose 1,7-bisphosphate phosphatase